MNLFIPPLGTKLRLLADWRFPLHFEYRNADAWEVLVGEEIDRWGMYRQGVRAPVPVTIPTGTILVVERIYIRKGAEDFDSITFRVVGGPDRSLYPKTLGGTAPKKCRFWAKLGDVNGVMPVEIID